MFDRFFISIIHPSRIGFFVKDKIWMPLLHILIFFLVLTSMIAVRCFTTDYFSGIVSKSIVNSIEDAKIEISTVYADNKLTGKDFYIEYEGLNVYFLRKQNNLFASGADVEFNEETVTFSYIFEKKTISYKDLGFNHNFNIENVRKHIQEDRTYFKTFIDKTFNEFNFYYQRALFFTNTLFLLIMIGICYALCVLVSYFTNPPIDKPIRTKLCLYDLLVFFFPLSLTIVFSTNWIMYIGLILPVIFTRITFSHIMKVRIRK